MNAAPLIDYLDNPPEVVHARFLSFSKEGETEIVELEVEVDLPQRPLYPIQSIERLRVRFTASDSMPAVFVTREDFPEVPHLILNEAIYPRQLCLYERSWADERGNWTPRSFVERIRHWLAGTADGTLHPTDQHLEPVIQHSNGRLVLPKFVYTPGKACRVERYYLTLRSGNYIVASSRKPEKGEMLPVPLLFVQGPPVTHGIMNRSPATLAELEQLLTKLGGSLVEILSHELGTIQKELADVGQQPMILVLELPKRRVADGPVESVEFQAFLIGNKIGELLKEEVIQVQDDVIWVPQKRALFRDVAKLKDIVLGPLSVRWHLSPTIAAAMNGFVRSTIKIVSLGAGALGSQVANNLWRGGYGQWTVIDDDLLEPHNTARHQLDSHAVGYNKAYALATTLAAIFPEQEGPQWIDANYLNPGEAEPRMTAAIESADLIIDFSASVAVGRFLADDKRGKARRVSAFLNQRGDESVILVEDAQRKTNLTWLEAEYLRSVAYDSALQGHFSDSRIVAHRYGTGCRDISSTVSQESIALHAGLIAAEIRNAVATPTATISVRRWSRASGAVTVVKIPVVVPTTVELAEWKIMLHPAIARQLSELRAEKLPSETGGVLLGLVDRSLRSIAIIGLLAAPPDSEAWPTSFIRGSVGLKAAVDRVTKNTLGNIQYVGEWHSHPNGCSSLPSALDVTAVELCSVNTRAEGLPTLMLIVANGECSFVVKPTDQSQFSIFRLVA